MAKTLGEFILEEMRKRDMSARKFADLVGVTSTVINKFLNHGINEYYGEQLVGNPSLEVLQKLAKATDTDICYLLELTLPDAPRAPNPSLTALRLSRRIEKLPENVQEAIDGFIMKLLAD